MDMNQRFAEQVNVITAVPSGMQLPGGLATPWFSMKFYRRATFLLIGAATGAGETPILTLQQAQDVSGTAAKALPVITIVDAKTDAAALSNIGTFTEIRQTAAATFTGAAATQVLYAVDVRVEELDLTGGFDCMRGTVADTGATVANGVLCALLWGTRYQPMFNPLAN